MFCNGCNGSLWIIILIIILFGCGGTASGGSEGTLTRQGDTLLLTVINQKGLALPATGVTTPQLPKAVLGLTALLEALALYAYQRGGKRRKRRHDG